MEPLPQPSLSPPWQRRLKGWIYTLRSDMLTEVEALNGVRFSVARF